MPRQQFKANRAAGVKIQSFFRMVACRAIYAAKKKEQREETAMASRMSMIQQTFHDDASTIQGTVFSVDEGLLEEVETRVIMLMLIRGMHCPSLFAHRLPFLKYV